MSHFQKRKPRKRERGSVLILSFMTFAILFTAGQALFTRILTERKLAEIDLARNQAFYLAEGGKNTALAELRERTIGNISDNLQAVVNINTLRAYLTPRGSLELMRDFAYQGNADTRFTVETLGEERATLVIQRPDAGTGSYTALIEIFSNGVPAEDPPEVMTFPYRFQISSAGNANLSDTDQYVQASGTFNIVVRRDNFARYALFTDTHLAPSGSIVWFTNRTNFYGPVHSNDRFSFANNPSGSFTDKVSQLEQTARFYNRGGSYAYLDADRNADLDVPTFNAGFSRGSAEIPLPSTVDQQTQQRAALGLSDLAVIPALTSGVYLPQQDGVLKGGIYVQGDARNISLSVVGGHQRYSIRQGTRTTEITVNRDTDTTQVDNGNSATTYTGTPRGILYVDGEIQNLQGTVADRTQVTVASTNDLQIRDHVRYENYSTTPRLNAAGANNILGMLSWRGNVRIRREAPDDIHVHATVMAPEGVFTVDDYNRGSPRGTANILGGVITQRYGAFGTFNSDGQVSGYGRNFIHDRRMLEGQSPPYFPTITSFTSTNNGVNNLPAWDQIKGSNLDQILENDSRLEPIGPVATTR